MACVRGYHVYKDQWVEAIGQIKSKMYVCVQEHCKSSYLLFDVENIFVFLIFVVAGYQQKTTKSFQSTVCLQPHAYVHVYTSDNNKQILDTGIFVT